MAKLKLLLLALCFFWSIPSPAQPRTRYIPRIEAALPPKADAGSIQAVTSRPDRNFVALGRFAAMASVGAADDELLTAAKEKAAELGADFVWIVKTEESGRLRLERPTAGLEAGRKRPAPRMGMTATPALYAIIGAYTKAAIGLLYEDRQTNMGHLIVRDFRASSNAPAAGIRIGDEVVGINELPIGDDKLQAMTLALQPGQVAKLLVKRGDATLTVDVELIPND